MGFQACAEGSILNKHGHLRSNRWIHPLAGKSSTHASEAAQRYASALFDLAQDSGALADTHREFKEFAELATGNDELSDLLSSPLYARDVKVGALADIASKAGVSPLLSKFLGVMASNGRARDIVGAQKAFDDLYAKQRGVKRAVVRTAKDMTDAQRERLEGIIAKAVGGDVELSTETDPDLVGGIQLLIGSTLVDASLKTKLDRMNAAMKGA